MVKGQNVTRLTGRVLTQVKPMNRARGGAAAVTMGGILYVAGGSEYHKLGSRGGECYFPALDIWQDLPEMAHRRFQCTLTAFEGSLYCAGGGEEGSSTYTVERLDPRMAGWVQVLSLFHPPGPLAEMHASFRIPRLSS